LYNAYFPYSTGGTINHSSATFKSVSDTVRARNVTYLSLERNVMNRKNKDES